MKSLSDEFKSRTDAYILQRAKFEALRDALGKYGNFRYVNFYDLLDPNNQNWNDYTYKLPDSWFSRGHGRVEMDSPVGLFISKIRDAENTDDIKKQLDVWNLYKPFDTPSGQRNYVDYFLNGGSRSVQTDNTGGTQGAVAVGSTQGSQAGNTGGGTPSAQGVQAGATTGNAVVGGGVQGSNNGSGGAQGAQTGGTGGTGSSSGGGTLASAGVPRGGTKTIGFDDPYDPNPGNISLAYVMRNAPEQERRDALINKWNREHGRESVPYIPGTEIPAGSLNRSSSTYASPGISSGGTYATGEGIKDANGNVLTNPGGDWEYQYALKNPQYGLGMMSKMSDAQKNYLQAVSNDMGYNYNFTGAPRYV